MEGSLMRKPLCVSASVNAYRKHKLLSRNNSSRITAAFTLIELLVVVGIIAILALIALPNLLEAQTRAKIARCKSDMRTIATAMEAYAVDQNKYPPNFDTLAYDPPAPTEYRTYAALSTPISYISTTPTDVFRPDPSAP